MIEDNACGSAVRFPFAGKVCANAFALIIVGTWPIPKLDSRSSELANPTHTALALQFMPPLPMLEIPCDRKATQLDPCAESMKII
eukprot:1148055-Pelagomonas_calceolata.AAC.1